MIEWDLVRTERRMRPGGSSRTGFLSPSESLDSVIQRDLVTLRSKSISPEQVGDRLESIIGQAHRLVELGRLGLVRLDRGAAWALNNGKGPGVRVEGRYRVLARQWRGSQECPFEDSLGNVCEAASYSSADYKIDNLATGEQVRFPGLIIHLARDHHFFEGNVPYRLDPGDAVEGLELQIKRSYRPVWSDEMLWLRGARTDHLPSDIKDWSMFDDARHTLGNPERTRRLSRTAQLFFRGPNCVAVVAESIRTNCGWTEHGAIWMTPELHRGTYEFSKYRHRFVVPLIGHAAFETLI